MEKNQPVSFIPFFFLYLGFDDNSLLIAELVLQQFEITKRLFASAVQSRWAKPQKPARFLCGSLLPTLSKLGQFCFLNGKKVGTAEATDFLSLPQSLLDLGLDSFHIFLPESIPLLSGVH